MPGTLCSGARLSHAVDYHPCQAVAGLLARHPGRSAAGAGCARAEWRGVDMTESRRASRVGRNGSRSRDVLRRWPTAALLAVLALSPGGALGAAVGAAPASQTGTSASRTWKVEPTPNPAGGTIDELSAVSCISRRACTAVGSESASLSSPSLTLVERWNGRRWRIQHTGLPRRASSGGLFGVSCASAKACTAVGSAFNRKAGRSVNLAEAWDGTRWRLRAVPNPKRSTNGSLLGVSCTSRRACTAVGFYDTGTAGRTLAVAERWNGTRWRIQPTRRPAGTLSDEFVGVSCSTRHACTAVGYQNNPITGARPLVEAWNGTKWHVQVVPLPPRGPGGILTAVSCTSPSGCTATGANFDNAHPTLAARWNGTRWHVQPTPTPKNASLSKQEVQLNAVSCPSARSCVATGEYAPGGRAAYFLESWNGRRWRLVTAPHPAGFVQGTLNGMSCALARCAAVGAWSGGAVPVATLAIAN